MQSQDKLKTPYLHPEFISDHAFRIVKALQDKGHTTYLVGGCVRDLLLGVQPKDFDIATTARPNEVRRSVSQAYVIGKRFRLVLVKRGDQQYEVATFRRNASEEDQTDDEMPTGDNLFGSPQEDAQRRDFTINAMFYDPVRKELIDHISGKDDLDEGLIRMIGDPDARLIEDPIRILRAIRLAHKIQFALDTELRISIAKNSGVLEGSALPRRREEYLKFLRLKEPHLAFLDSYDLGVLRVVSPTLHKIFADSQLQEDFSNYLRNFHDVSKNLEDPVELFASLVWAVVRTLIAPDPEKNLKAKELLENDSLLSFMRDELGMFKYEQALACKALQLQSLLQKPTIEFDDFSPRRQAVFLRAEAFPLALSIARMDYSLPVENYVYWSSKYKEMEPMLETLSQPQKKKKKKRRKRKKPR